MSAIGRRLGKLETIYQTQPRQEAWAVAERLAAHLGDGITAAEIVAEAARLAEEIGPPATPERAIAHLARTQGIDIGEVEAMLAALKEVAP